MTLKAIISLGLIGSLFGGLGAEAQPVPICVQKKILRRGSHTTQVEVVWEQKDSKGVVFFGPTAMWNWLED